MSSVCETIIRNIPSERLGRLDLEILSGNSAADLVKKGTCNVKDFVLSSYNKLKLPGPKPHEFELVVTEDKKMKITFMWYHKYNDSGHTINFIKCSNGSEIIGQVKFEPFLQIAGQKRESIIDFGLVEN